MSKAIKQTFAGGELSTDLDGRTDLAKYATGAQLLKNFYPTRFGGVSNRPGAEYIGLTPHSPNNVHNLIPFQFSTRQTYALEFVGRDISYLNSFNDSVIDPDWSITTSTAPWTFGGGRSYITPIASEDSRLSTTLAGAGVAPEYGNFEISGTMTSSNFPDGSATDVWTNQQFVEMVFAGGEELQIGFENGSAFSGPSYTGYRIRTTSAGGGSPVVVYINSTDFTDIGWSVKKDATAVTIQFKGTTYTMSATDTIGVAIPLRLHAYPSGTTPPEMTCEWSGIQSDTLAGSTDLAEDDVMRVIKEGSIVLTSRRSSTYKWTASGSGTSEYYCELAAGGDPSIPGAVELWQDGSLMTNSTLGSLSAGEWAFGDNDSLGYATIYVRLTDSADPDTKDEDYLQSDYQVATGIYAYNLNEVTFAQDADTLFLAGNFSPKKVVRSADDVWAISDVTFTASVPSPTDFYASSTGFTANDREVLYKISAIDDSLNESLPTSEKSVSLDLNWPTAGRVDLYWNNITDGLESTPIFRWISSPAAANEFYCELAGGGDPSLSDPETIWEDKTAMVEGTVGSLAIGEWAYGDNDSLGFNTIYVRIAASADPDTKAVGYITFKLASEDQWNIYKNYDGDWGWLAAVQTPWFLDKEKEPLVSVTPKVGRDPFNTGSVDDWPWAVGLYEQRLIYARSNNKPQNVWTSTTGDLTNLSISQPLSAEDPITVKLISGGRVDEIRHLLPLDKLMVFTSGSEWTLAPNQDSSALTPFSREFRNQGYEGISSTVPPLGINNRALFVQRSGQDIRSTAYSADNGGYPSSELSLLAQHLFEGKTIIDWCYQQHPDNLIIAILDDGTAVSITFLPEQELVAFARWETDGLYKACASTTTNGDDAVYFAVERTINGTRTRFLESMSTRYFGSNVRDAKFLDCALTYNEQKAITGIAVGAGEIRITIPSHGYSNGDFVLIDDVVGITATGANSDYLTQFNDKKYIVGGVTTNTFALKDLDDASLTSVDFTGSYISGGFSYKCTKAVTGLDHLEGEVVKVLADGMALGSTFTVASGSITLTAEDPGFAVVHVGLGYNCDLQTLRFDLPSGQSTLQYSRSKLKKLILRLKNSSGGYAAGNSFDNLTIIKWRQNEEWQQPNSLTTGDVEHILKSGWDREGRVYFRQSDPLPMTILALIMHYEAGDSQ